VLFDVRKVYEARIADLKEAHAREVDALKMSVLQLVEQIEYLRMTGGVKPLPAVPAQGHPNQPVIANIPPFMDEEEEDVRAMHDNGLIDVHELEAALRELHGDH